MSKPNLDVHPKTIYFGHCSRQDGASTTTPSRGEGESETRLGED